jgi:hypothetical protein
MASDDDVYMNDSGPESITPTQDRLDENSKNTNEDASNDAFCSSAETSDASSMSDSSKSYRKKRKFDFIWFVKSTAPVIYSDSEIRSSIT